MTRAVPLLTENRLGLLALAATMTAPALLSGSRGRFRRGVGWGEAGIGEKAAIKVAPICTKCQTPSLQLLPQLKKRGKMKKKSKAS